MSLSSPTPPRGVAQQMLRCRCSCGYSAVHWFLSAVWLCGFIHRMDDGGFLVGRRMFEMPFSVEICIRIFPGERNAL